MTEQDKSNRDFMAARDIIAGVFLEVCPSYGKERCENFAATTIERLERAGFVVIRFDIPPGKAE